MRCDTPRSIRTHPNLRGTSIIPDVRIYARAHLRIPCTSVGMPHTSKFLSDGPCGRGNGGLAPTVGVVSIHSREKKTEPRSLLVLYSSPVCVVHCPSSRLSWSGEKLIQSRHLPSRITALISLRVCVRQDGRPSISAECEGRQKTLRACRWSRCWQHLATPPTVLAPNSAVQ